MTSKNPTATEASLGTEILSYLIENPDAGDTYDGIVEWWFLEQGIRRAEHSVRETLDLLVAQDLLLESRIAGSQVQYRLNRDRLPQIKAQLEDGGSRSRAAAERHRSRDRKES